MAERRRKKRNLQEVVSAFEARRYGKLGIRSVGEADLDEKARDLLVRIDSVEQEEKNRRPIISFCRGLDVLCGGARSQKVLEICGKSGTGKTQLGLQFCIDATIPLAFKGCAGQAIFIDNDASFSHERAHDLATGMIHHLHRLVNKKKQDNFPIRDDDISIESILQKISVYRCLNHRQFIAVLDTLLYTIEYRKTNYVIIVIDSIASHFRQSNTIKPWLLSALNARLAALANHGLAIVVTNQITSAPDLHGYIPTLGTAWSHLPDTRILLSSHQPPLDHATQHNQQQLRLATLLKGGNLSPGSSIPFIIDHRGFRDLSSSPPSPHQPASLSASSAAVI